MAEEKSDINTTDIEQQLPPKRVPKPKVIFDPSQGDDERDDCGNESELRKKALKKKPSEPKKCFQVIRDLR